jgi:hypothetical protein
VSDYQPTPANPLTYASWWFEKNGNGPIPDFEAFNPNPKYYFPKKKRVYPDKWPIIVPEHAPAVATNLEDIMYKMMEVSWKFSEPQGGVQRGMAGGHNYDPPVIGTRGMPQLPPVMTTRGMPQSLGKLFVPPGEGYHPQVRPTKPWMDVMMPNKSAIAMDWDLHGDMQRTNAVSFRADKRPPYEVIVNQEGFNPPDTRKDPTYLERNIYGEFTDYMARRYGRPMVADQATFLNAVNRELTFPGAKELLFEYLVWRSIVKKESAHMARMTDNELLKGWTSTSKCIDNSINFAVLNKTPGWLYVVKVYSGYVVPFFLANAVMWGTREAEIAQYGPIPADRIVGFVYMRNAPQVEPEGPIFMRKSFRESEPKAFDFMFDMMSGGCPE